MTQESTPTDGRDRFRKLLDRIDEQEGVEDRPLPVPVAAPPLSAVYEMKAAQNGRQPSRGLRNIFTWDGFKTFAILFSFIVNTVLVVVVLVLATSVFKLKSDIADPLVGGLHDNFVALDQATIRTTIPVLDSTPKCNGLLEEYLKR